MWTEDEDLISRGDGDGFRCVSLWSPRTMATMVNSTRMRPMTMMIWARITTWEPALEEVVVPIGACDDDDDAAAAAGAFWGNAAY